MFSLFIYLIKMQDIILQSQLSLWDHIQYRFLFYLIYIGMYSCV